MSIEYLENKTTNYIRSRRRLREIEEEMIKLREEKRLLVNVNYQPLSAGELDTLRDTHDKMLRVKRSPLFNQGHILFPKYWVFEFTIDYNPVSLSDLLDYLILQHLCSVEYSNTMRLSCHAGDIIRFRKSDGYFCLLC